VGHELGLRKEREEGRTLSEKEGRKEGRKKGRKKGRKEHSNHNGRKRPEKR
jgi:hypothetical protein